MPVITPQKSSSLAPKIQDMPQGVHHVCLDIETMEADKKVIDAAKARWKAPWNLKDPEKIKAHQLAFEKSCEEDSALLDGSPVAVLCVITEKGSVLFTCASSKKAIAAIKNIPAVIYQFKTEREMLEAARTWLDNRTRSELVVVGFNLLGFDNPRLRMAYLRNRLRLPVILQPEARDVGVEVYDVMVKFLRSFTAEKNGEKFIGLEEVMGRLDLPTFQSTLDGAAVPGYLKQGKVKEVLTKCYLDTAGTYQAFLMMTSQYKDQDSI
jgi:hypothetical protein